MHQHGQVASSFNLMAIELGRQFKSLNIRSEIDRAVLATLEPSEIARTSVQDMRHIHPCKGICVTIAGNDDSGSIDSYFSRDVALQGMGKESSVLRRVEMERMRAALDTPILASSEETPRFLKPLVRQGMTAFHIFPIFLQENLAGIVSLGYEGRSSALEETELVQVRQLVDQVGVALSNTRLIKELQQFHWGTLTALARAIDAKSHWTAGHSEKVTRIASKIGKALKLNPEELDILRRGGLLHDIGKLGIANSILDKKGPLKPEEIAIIQTHPFLGAQILEPISSFADVMNIVLQHHENFDGSGDPNPLSGENISLQSRIVAVADRYDAMTADRPYRKALKLEPAVNEIMRQSGFWFDPKVVRAFVEVIDQPGCDFDRGGMEAELFIDRAAENSSLLKDVRLNE
jgi:putative nucleotidyltransferase with HDIG domain